jgi:hypothetical protein
MTAEFLWINIGFAAVFVALWSGIPLWMILKRPDRDPRETRTLPAYMRQGMAPGLPAQREEAAREPRELVSAGRS